MGMVKEELEKVKDDDVRNMQSRLSLIEKQMTEVQSRLEKKQKEADDLGTKIVQMQQEVAQKTKL